MKSILGFVRQNCINRGQLYVGSPRILFNTTTQTSWLSSAASNSGGKGSSKKGAQGSGESRMNNDNFKKSSSRSPSQSFKKMADIVKEKTTRLRSSAGSVGDKVSSDRVKHERSSKRFTLDLGNNQLARIDYKTIGPADKIDMYHSEVPKELRGKGLGKALATGALEQAARENLRVKLSCTYLIDFVNKSTDPKLKKTLINSDTQHNTKTK